MQKIPFPREVRLRHVGQTIILGRRPFLSLLGFAALSARAGRAEEPLPAIGFLYDGSSTHAAPLVSAFWRALNRAGFVETQNIAAIYWASEGHDERLAAVALDLCRQDIAILIAGGAKCVAAARQATDKIPIVFVAASDPARDGFGLERAGNATGVNVAVPELLVERFQILLELVPTARSVAALINPQTFNIEVQLQYLSDEAKRRGIYLQRLNASTEVDFGAALEEIAQHRQDALLVANDTFLNSGRDQIVAVTRTSKFPAAFPNREYVEAGGLMSYGPSLIEAYEQAGAFAGRILKGEKPGRLPIQHPLEMEIALNAQAAKALGFVLAPALRAAASEVIG